MMGQGSYMAPAGGNPAVAVVGQQFMVPYPVDLTIVRKMLTISEGNFGVTDANGNIMFKVKGKLLSLRDRRILLDAAGNPILSLQQKFAESVASLLHCALFYPGKPLFLQLRLFNSWFERSCSIYAGNTSTVIAQMHRKHSVSSIVLGKDKFAVTVYPHVDYAFIVALIVILEEINEDRNGDD